MSDMNFLTNSINVDCTNMNSIDIDEVFALVKTLGKDQYVLHMDSKVLSSNQIKGRNFKFATGKVPTGSIGLRELRQSKAAIEVYRAMEKAGKMDSEEPQPTMKIADVPTLEKKSSGRKPRAKVEEVIVEESLSELDPSQDTNADNS